MGKELEKTSLQRRHTNRQQAYEAETTQCPTDEWIIKCGVCIQWLSFSLKKEVNYDICYPTDET